MKTTLEPALYLLGTENKNCKIKYITEIIEVITIIKVIQVILFLKLAETLTRIHCQNILQTKNCQLQKKSCGDPCRLNIIKIIKICAKSCRYSCKQNLLTFVQQSILFIYNLLTFIWIILLTKHYWEKIHNKDISIEIEAHFFLLYVKKKSCNSQV